MTPAIMRRSSDSITLPVTKLPAGDASLLAGPSGAANSTDVLRSVST